MNASEQQATESIFALSQSVTQKIEAARTIKNAVVGNPTNKRLYLAHGALIPLTNAANQVQTQPELAAQAVAALGSLACFITPASILTVIPTLFRCLFADSRAPVHAAARALKLLVISDSADIRSLAPTISVHDVARRIVSLLAESDEGIAEVCAVIIARTCLSVTHAHIYERVSAISALVTLLWRTNHERCVEACLSALAALARQSEPISKSLTASHNIVTLVMPMTRSTVYSLRLAACRLLTIFHSAKLLRSGLDSIVTTSLVQLLNTPNRAAQVSTAYTLAEMVKDCQQLQSVATGAGVVSELAKIISDVSELEHSNDADVAMRDVRECERERPGDRNALKASAFTALAAITSNFDQARDAVISYEVLPAIIDALSEKTVEVVLASIKCIRSLSRSVKILRRDIAKESVGRIFLDLLNSPCMEVRRCASATLCNLVLEFSPARGIVLDNGGSDVLVKLLRSEDEELRKNALWALKNLLFNADCKTKADVMMKLGYDNLLTLCADAHPQVREIAMTFVRNLASSGSSKSNNEQVDAMFAATSNRLISVLSNILGSDTSSFDIALQALYVVCNIASGTEEHKACIMKSDVPHLLLQWTAHEDEKARIAAIWCVINLSGKEGVDVRTKRARKPRAFLRSAARPTSRLEMLRRQRLPVPSSPVDRSFLDPPDSTGRHTAVTTPESAEEVLSDADMEAMEPESSEEHYNPSERENAESRMDSQDMFPSIDERQDSSKKFGYEWRIERLRALGYEGRLRSLVNDPHIEVQGRAREALELFDCNDVDPLDYNPSALLDCTPSSVMSRRSPRSTSVLQARGGRDSALIGPPS